MFILSPLMSEPVIGLDFGTTNSAIAVAGSDRQATLATFGRRLRRSFRSILYFPAKERGSQQKTETQAGPDAINSYLEADTKGTTDCLDQVVSREPSIHFHQHQWTSLYVGRFDCHHPATVAKGGDRNNSTPQHLGSC